jgi:hypothetical protein
MKILDPDFRSDAARRRFPAPRSAQSSQLSRRPLAPVRASAIAPGLRELRAWELPQGAVGRCQLAAGEIVTLTGISGQCWITLQGDRHDYLLVPGKTLRFTGPGRLVFEAVGDETTLAVS